MKVLVAFEFSGVVRRAFRNRGHDAWSLDILPSLDDSPHHLQQYAEEIDFSQGWDLVIAHPPCTALCVSGNGTYAPGMPKAHERPVAIEFFRWVLNWPVEKLCVENPIGVISTAIRPPDQYIQPWMFGHGELKKTGLWLKNLPKLTPTNIVEGRSDRIRRMGEQKDRGLKRSITYEGIAEAMAEQWS